mmetsp:Transcript_60420/g.129563  ORF Transcript_60420/g.129563 Transcript_60420/m.129563 type:complete len:405 (-) Transcript_60420:7-1221(-)
MRGRRAECSPDRGLRDSSPSCSEAAHKSSRLALEKAAEHLQVLGQVLGQHRKESWQHLPSLPQRTQVDGDQDGIQHGCKDTGQVTLRPEQATGSGTAPQQEAPAARLEEAVPAPASSVTTAVPAALVAAHAAEELDQPQVAEESLAQGDPRRLGRLCFSTFQELLLGMKPQSKALELEGLGKADQCELLISAWREELAKTEAPEVDALSQARRSLRRRDRELAEACALLCSRDAELQASQALVAQQVARQEEVDEDLRQAQFALQRRAEELDALREILQQRNEAWAAQNTELSRTRTLLRQRDEELAAARSDSVRLQRALSCKEKELQRRGNCSLQIQSRTEDLVALKGELEETRHAVSLLQTQMGRLASDNSETTCNGIEARDPAPLSTVAGGGDGSRRLTLS